MVTKIDPNVTLLWNKNKQSRPSSKTIKQRIRLFCFNKNKQLIADVDFDSLYNKNLDTTKKFQDLSLTSTPKHFAEGVFRDYKRKVLN